MDTEPEPLAVTLVTPDGARITAGVARRDGPSLVVRPRGPYLRARNLLGVGTHLDVGWAHAMGWAQSEAKVTGWPTFELVEVRLSGEPAVVQRRGAVRAKVGWAVELSPAPGEHPRVVVAQTIDLSATGVAVRSVRAFDPGTPVVLCVWLPETGAVLALAIVMGYGEENERLRLRFTSLLPGDDERIAAAVLRELGRKARP